MVLKYPIVIVGAGLSGLRAASLLTKEGIDCLAYSKLEIGLEVGF